MYLRFSRRRVAGSATICNDNFEGAVKCRALPLVNVTAIFRQLQTPEKRHRYGSKLITYQFHHGYSGIRIAVNDLSVRTHRVERF